MQPEPIRVGIVGAGYWGPNLIRTFSSLPGCTVAYVCDQRPGRLQYVAERFGGIELTDRFEDLAGDPTLDALVICTPVSTHRPLAEAALNSGKHVFVEKPLAATPADAVALIDASRRAHRILATGHLFVYHPAIARMRELARAGELGALCYAESGRVNLGPPASEVDVIWDLAVHDVAILLSIVGREPQDVRAEGRRYIHPSLIDVAFLTLRFDDGFVAQHHVSWLSPLKTRRFFLCGTGGSAAFDDMRDDAKLVLTDRGEDSRMGQHESDNRELFYRAADIRMPTLAPTPPLTMECDHFLQCIRTGHTPEADGQAGLSVVRVLSAAEQSVAANGATVCLAPIRSVTDLEVPS